MAFLRVSNFAFLLFFVLLHVNTFLNAAPGKSERATNLKSKLSRHPKLVVLSFDGFRYDFISKIDMPNFRRIRSEGIYADSLRTRFPSKTFPNHQSIATGLYPESHGVVGNQKVYDELLGYEVGPSDEKFWNYRPDVAPIWIHNEWAGNGRYSGSNWAGSTMPYGSNRTRQTYVFDYKSSDFNSRMDEIINSLTDTNKPANLLTMYFNEPDKTEHSYGPESTNVLTAIKKVDDATGYLLRRLEETGIKDEVNLIVLSDHGFQEVSKKKLINISKWINQDWVHTPYISSPVFMIAPNAGKTQAVYDQLKAASSGNHFTVYKREDIPESWHFKYNDRRIYRILVVADLGYIFEDENRSGYGTDQKFGVHGYDNNADTMKAFFMGTGPAFKKNYKYPQTFSNVDVFPFMCNVLHLNPPPNNGSMLKIGPGLL